MDVRKKRQIKAKSLVLSFWKAEGSVSQAVRCAVFIPNAI